MSDTTETIEIIEVSEEPVDGPKPSKWPTTLIAIATVLAVVSTLTTWVKVQALETDSWVELSEELILQEEVQEALAVYIVNELYDALDIPGELENALPDDFGGLAGPISAALRGPATDGVKQLLASNQFRAVWTTVNRAAHETLVAIIRDETIEGTSTADGEVTLDLRALLVATAESLGLSGDRIAQLPEDAGKVVIFQSDELAAVQDAVKLLDLMSWFLFLVVVALYAAAVYLARDRRRIMLRRVGVGLIVAGVVILVARSVAVQSLTTSLVESPSNRPLVEITAGVATALIRQMAWTGVVFGVLIVLFATLLGEGPRATATRRFLAPLFTASAWAVAGGTVVALLILLWWNPGGMFDRWPATLLTIGLIVGAVIVLRRQALRDHADATAAGSWELIVATVRRDGASGDTVVVEREVLDDAQTASPSR